MVGIQGFAAYLSIRMGNIVAHARRSIAHKAKTVAERKGPLRVTVLHAFVAEWSHQAGAGCGATRTQEPHAVVRRCPVQQLPSSGIRT